MELAFSMLKYIYAEQQSLSMVDLIKTTLMLLYNFKHSIIVIMIVIAIAVVFEDIYVGNFILKENFRVQHENLPGTYLKPLISLFRYFT